jgi:predicted CXXCH cytochrome family protein
LLRFRWFAGLAAASLIGAVGWAARPWLWTIAGLGTTTRTSPPRTRDVYADSPYRNARPGVGYVGDEACARCHREIAEAYRSHPMGRSMAPLGGVAKRPPIGASAGLPFEAKGAQFLVEERDGRVFHAMRRRDAEGRVFAENEAEVRYALGSGTRGIAFLIDRDGFLFQSPIAWFAQPGRWDTSPGYGEFDARPDFERPIQPECLSCHANQFRPVAGTLNRYEPPIFQGHSIGCERCHGPGALHVNREGPSAGPDLTIVNPADLAPALRESVCQQCHLQGTFRFPRAGRGPLDFRPGLPIHRFWAFFLMRAGSRGKFEAVGHVEQMESSRCFRASEGRLGCISCHDPHRLPAPSTKAAYYRGRCLGCHEQKGCALPPAARRARGRADDCVACHMPRPAMSNIPHTAATDHRIPRGVPGSEPEGPRAGPGQPAKVPLFDYHAGQMTEEERRASARDLGIALRLGARLMGGSSPLAKVAAAQAVPSLEAAIRERPDDLPARESLGQVLGMLDRNEEALRVYEGLLRIEPNHESALRSSGRVLTRLRRPELARPALEGAIAVDPWRSEYRLGLAGVRGQARDWAGAAAACREAIRLNPESVEARSFLVECCLRAHRPEEADAEFRTLLRFHPAGREVWQQWYTRQQQEARDGVRLPLGGRGSQ